MPTAAEQLRAASEGLLMPSESEAPFEVLAFAAPGPADADYLRAHAGVPADAPVEEVTLDHLLRNVAFAHDWHDDGQRAAVPRFAALKAAVESALAGVRVFRAGGPNVIDVFIVGTAGGGVAGLKTSLVET